MLHNDSSLCDDATTPNQYGLSPPPKKKEKGKEMFTTHSARGGTTHIKQTKRPDLVDELVEGVLPVRPRLPKVHLPRRERQLPVGME